MNGKIRNFYMIRGLLLIVSFLFFNIAANAQIVINIEEARLLGLSSSQTLADAQTSIRVALLNEKTHFYSMIPQVSAGYRASISFLEDTRFVSPIDTFSAGINLSVTQTIFNGGNSFATKSMREIATETARVNASRDYFSVLNSIDEAYYAVLRAEAALESAQSLLEASNLALSIAQVRFSNGMLNQIDYLRAQADKESRENTRNQSQRTLSLRLIELRDLIGIQGAISLEPVSFDAYDEALRRLAGISTEETDELFTELWNIMIANNPSLKTAALRSQNAELTYTNSVRQEYMPKVNLSLSANLLNFSARNGFNGSGNINGSISVTGSIPIDYWVISNRLENYKITRDSALNDFTSTMRASQNKLLSDIYELLNQASSVLSSRRSLEITENTYNGTLERYLLSQSSVKDLSDAANSLMDSRNSLNNANYYFLQRLSALRTSCALDDEQRLINILLGN